MAPIHSCVKAMMASYMSINTEVLASLGMHAFLDPRLLSYFYCVLDSDCFMHTANMTHSAR